MRTRRLEIQRDAAASPQPWVTDESNGVLLRSFSSSSPLANSSSLKILPASTSARIAGWALYSLFSTPALFCSIPLALLGCRTQQSERGRWHPDVYPKSET